MRHMNKAREHFTVGNVVYSAYWRQYDLVLDYSEGDHGWVVTVQDCDKFGNATRGQHVRMHSTFPSEGDKVVCNVLHYSPCITFDRVIHSV